MMIVDWNQQTSVLNDLTADGSSRSQNFVEHKYNYQSKMDTKQRNDKYHSLTNDRKQRANHQNTTQASSGHAKSTNYKLSREASTANTVKVERTHPNQL